MANVGQEFKFDTFTGLFTSANPFSRAPRGSFDILDNCVVKQPGLLEPRRGYSLQSTLPGSLPAASLTSIVSSGVPYVFGHVPGSGAVEVAQTTGLTSANLTQVVGTTFAGTLQAPFNAARARFARLVNTYVSTGFGLFASEDQATIRSTVWPVIATTWSPNTNSAYSGSYGTYGTFATVSSSGSNNWLPNNSLVGYCFLVCRKGAQGDLALGPPSAITYVGNVSGSTAHPTLLIQRPVLCPPDAFIRVYRTHYVSTTQNLPVDYYLVTELALGTTTGPTGYATPDTGSNAGPETALTYVDIVPDGAIYVPLYTNPTDGGGIQSSSNTPPIMADVAAYKGALWGGNTKDVERYVLQLTGVDPTNGLAVGATITIDGVTYTWGTGIVGTPTVPNRSPYLLTAGTAGQNTVFSSRELEAAINWYYSYQAANNLMRPEQMLRAQYIEGQNGAPGQILIQRLVPGAQPFVVQASSPNGIGNNLTGTGGQSNNNAQVSQIVYTPFGQPNCWPTAFSTPVGDSTADILKLVSTKDTLWIFKKDGLWTLQASPTPSGSFQLNVVCFDPTIILVAPDSAVVLNNEVYALCREGVLRINEQGKTNISLPIQREMQKQIDFLYNPSSTTGATFGQNAAWAMAYESEHFYVLAIPESLQTYPTKYYVFEADTGAWSTWSFQQALSAGIVDKGANLTVLAAVNGQQWIERKNYISSDHQDVPFTIACPGTSNPLVFPTASHGISVGDIVSQIQGGTGSVYNLQHCTGVSGATVTLDAAPSSPWIVGSSPPLTIQKGITSTLRMLPVVGPTELFAKQFDETVQLYFRYFDCGFYSGSVATDEQPVTGAVLNPYVQNTYAANAWGSNNWGDGLFGGGNVMNFVSIFNIPRLYSRAAEMQLTLVFNNASTRFELIGLSVGASKSITERIVKA